MHPQDLLPPSPDVAAEDCRRASAHRLTAAMDEKAAMLALFQLDPAEHVDQDTRTLHELFEVVAEYVIDHTDCSIERGTSIGNLLSSLHFAKRAQGMHRTAA